MRLDGGATDEYPLDVREHASGMSEFRPGKLYTPGGGKRSLWRAWFKVVAKERGRARMTLAGQERIVAVARRLSDNRSMTGQLAPFVCWEIVFKSTCSLG